MSTKNISINEMLAEALKLEPKPLSEVLSDRELARLGDAYINFVYSLAVTIRSGKPSGLKLSNQVLAQATRISGLRVKMPRRLSKHDIGSSAEALLLYSIAKKLISTEEIVECLVTIENPEQALAEVLRRIMEKCWK